MFWNRKKSATFYPINFFTFGNRTPRLNKLQNNFALIDIFYSIPEVYIPITYISKKIASLEFELYLNDNLVTSNPILDILQSPNEFDSLQEFVQKSFIYRFLTGNVYLNNIPVVGFKKVTKIVVLDSKYVKINLTNTRDIRQKQILNYEYNVDGTISTIDKENILHFKDTNVDTVPDFWQYGKSRLLSAKYNITSIESGYSARCSLYQHGAKHILTGKGNEYTMLTPEQSREEQRRINNDFGLTENQEQLMLTRYPLEVTELSKSVQELQLNEMNLADFQRICSLYNVPTILLNDNVQSTYNNKEQAEKDFYLNVVIPYAQEFYDNLVYWISTLLKDNKKYTVKINMNKVYCLKDNLTQMSQRIIQELNSGIITNEEARKILGYDNAI